MSTNTTVLVKTVLAEAALANSALEVITIAPRGRD